MNLGGPLFDASLIANDGHVQEDGLFVKFEGWYQSFDHLYIAMEYFPKGDLLKCASAPLVESEVQVRSPWYTSPNFRNLMLAK